MIQLRYGAKLDRSMKIAYVPIGLVAVQTMPMVLGKTINEQKNETLWINQSIDQ